MKELLAQQDHGFALEDEACNSFAGLILLPDAAAADHFSDRGPTARDTVALWDASHASRAAVCVRAVEHLPAPGHVILLEQDGHVSFAASRGLPSVRRDSDQSAAEVIGAALGRYPMRGRGRTRLRYRNGITGDELYVQVAEMNGYAVAVLVVDHAPWETFSPPSVDTGPQGREWICTRCDDEFVSYSAPCARCGSPTCPTCERCACTAGPAAPDRMCDTCTIMRAGTMYEPGGTTCADCR